MAATEDLSSSTCINSEIKLIDNNTSLVPPSEYINSELKNVESTPTPQPTNHLNEFTRDSPSSSSSNEQNFLPSSANSENSRSSLVQDASSIQNPSSSSSSPQLPTGNPSASIVSTSTPSTNLQNSAPIISLGLTSLSRPSNEFEAYYYVKWVSFEGRRVPIIMQNANGPCPLLALCNVLLLRQRFQLPTGTEVVESAQLLQGLGNCMLENRPTGLTDEQAASWGQNMHDSIELVFPKLHTGLDVNVKFDSVSSIEYTPELLIFDLLGVHLYHGWLVSPDDRALRDAVQSFSYNQLVEFIISNSSDAHAAAPPQSSPSTSSSPPSASASGQSADASASTSPSPASDPPGSSGSSAAGSTGAAGRAMLCHEFLDQTASQLTFAGINELQSTLTEGQVAVFFRNNHFSTIYKRNGRLYLLVTDQGYLSEPSVLWETLSTVDGDSELLDCNMHVFFKTASTSSVAASSKPPGQQGAGGGGGGGLLPTLTSTVSNALGALVGAGAGAAGTGGAAGAAGGAAGGGAGGKQLDDLAHERPARPVPFDAASTGSNSSSSSAASEATLVQQPIGAPAAPSGAAAAAAVTRSNADNDQELAQLLSNARDDNEFQRILSEHAQSKQVNAEYVQL